MVDNWVGDSWLVGFTVVVFWCVVIAVFVQLVRCTGSGPGKDPEAVRGVHTRSDRS